jgi:hypothetical protein
MGASPLGGRAIAIVGENAPAVPIADVPRATTAAAPVLPKASAKANQ